MSETLYSIIILVIGGILLNIVIISGMKDLYDDFPDKLIKPLLPICLIPGSMVVVEILYFAIIWFKWITK